MLLLHDWIHHRIVDSAIFPYVQLARWDRPTGWRLLLWPCLWSTILASYPLNRTGVFCWSTIFWHIFLYVLGAIIMRGAGCTWNDLVDHDIDKQCSRTQSRPLPLGKCSRFQAYCFAFFQLIMGFIVLIQFNYYTIYIGFILLAIIIVYPFAKRFMRCPQFVLSFCFAGGILIGWVSLQESLSWPVCLLYIGTMCWVVGYDAIYACQDKEDDELIGIGSAARVFANYIKEWLVVLYGMFIFLFMLAFYLIHVNLLAWIGLLIAFFLLIRQVVVLDTSCPDQCLMAFKNNDTIGMFIFISLIMSLYFEL
ncbi:MAG: 4-hydroxybenzoate octaprenyltransferase [Candidatus Liberibacter ctenarytainae]|uniref:4-hydroxybenzoate octaprenyltransferase n=1 Tax=Candidatus Liberibacter ctenarytainae TaxID=2020335 RepID=A0A937DM00_9HYPH|nr:4-hydroxybenzoate octaprenyltransferase [Candidatus Liberibacter ctenarytainae]